MKNRIEKNMVVGADMPAYKIALILLAYIFAPHNNDSQEDEEKLIRPDIDFKKSGYIFSLWIIFGLLLNFLINLLIENYFQSSFSNLITITIIYACFLFFMKSKIAIWMIRLYQNRAPAEVRIKCVLIPSCSEYMYLAIQKYGLINGVIKGIDRLRRCCPPTEIDYP